MTTPEARPAPTFRLETTHGVTAIRCLLCDRVSELPGDVTNRYCGRCHLFHDLVAEARFMVARYPGATHECEEWRTWRDRCAICDSTLPEPPSRR
jgi:hypothetical protein